jgi:D-glycero-alpha-D-manno-heptose-7-phosphate kinase
MIVRSRAPLRIGFAGGGTDVSPYSDLYGGAVLNATINRYCYVSITPRDDGQIVLGSVNEGRSLTLPATKELPIDGTLDLVKGVYNRIVRDYAHRPLAFELQSSLDAPLGSGLGTSSTLVVAIVGAFAEWLQLPLGEYDIARLAFDIERTDLHNAGGKQDQYAATFGGFNFMEFHRDGKVIVNPLRIRDEYLHELEYNLVLFHTGTTRLSARLIEAQVKNVVEKNERSIEATHHLKEQAVMMKEAVLTGRLDDIGHALAFGWEHKKRLAGGITNPMIDEIYTTAIAAGATGGKVTGAGGGGFMVYYCPGCTRHAVVAALKQTEGEVMPFQFAKRGVTAWRIG